jgi:hypothetical protein
MEPELWGGRYGRGGTQPHRAPRRPRHMGFLPAESIHGARLRVPAPAAAHPQFARILDRPDGDQFATSVVIRLGTSPTGTTALIVLLSVSMAVTDLMAAFEM